MEGQEVESEERSSDRHRTWEAEIEIGERRRHVRQKQQERKRESKKMKRNDRETEEERESRERKRCWEEEGIRFFSHNFSSKFRYNLEHIWVKKYMYASPPPGNVSELRTARCSTKRVLEKTTITCVSR